LEDDGEIIDDEDGSDGSEDDESDDELDYFDDEDLYDFQLPSGCYGSAQPNGQPMTNA
jgi:hypothetical protein